MAFFNSNFRKSGQPGLPTTADSAMIPAMHMKNAGFVAAALISVGICGLGCDSKHEAGPTTQTTSTGIGSSTSAAGAGIGSGDGTGSGVGTTSSKTGVSGTEPDSPAPTSAPSTEKSQPAEHK
jgi:hypothetical protein